MSHRPKSKARAVVDVYKPLIPWTLEFCRWRNLRLEGSFEEKWPIRKDFNCSRLPLLVEERILAITCDTVHILVCYHGQRKRMKCNTYDRDSCGSPIFETEVNQLPAVISVLSIYRPVAGKAMPARLSHWVLLRHCWTRSATWCPYCPWRRKPAFATHSLSLSL